MDIYRQVKDILKSSGLAVDEVGEIEKGYTKTIIVPPTGKKHGYTYQRTYDGIEGKGNKSRQSCNRDNIQTEFKNRIDSTEIRNLGICSDSDFSKYVDDMFNRNYRNIPSVIRMPDLNGNYLVTVGKKDKSSFGEGEFKIVGVGVAPTIHEIKKNRPTASLLASPTYSENIPYNFFAVNKSLHEQVKDILKSSGLSVGCEDVERASVGRERAWNIQKTNFLFGDDWETIIKSHQYSRKEFKNGSWRYYYDKHDSFSRMTQCKSVPLKISASMSARDIVLAATDYIQNVWLADWKQNPGKAICKELKGKVISFESISYKHLGNTGGNSKGGKQFRSIQNLIDHVRYLPLAKELLENNGIHTQSRYEEFDSPKSDGSIGLVYQTVSGIAPNGDTNNYVQVTVSQKKYKGGELGGTVYISVVGKKDIKKSLQKQGFLTTSRCVRQGCESYPATDKTIPRKSPVVNKSILFEFTDLTEEATEKAFEEYNETRLLQKEKCIQKAVDASKNHLEDYWVNGHHQRHWVSNETGERKENAYHSHKFKEKEEKYIHYKAKKLKDDLKKYFNTFFVNESNNFKVRFSKNSASKMGNDKSVTKSVVNGFTINEHFEAAENIKPIFENSYYIGTFSEDKNKDNVIDIKRFEKKINLSTGKKAYAYITIKNTLQGGNMLYSVELILKKYPSSIDGGEHQRLNKSVSVALDCNPLNVHTIPRKSPVVNKSILFEFTDLTPNNRKDKIEKAVRILSKQLGVPVAVERVHEHRGEAFAFKAQEELTYKWAEYLNNATKEVYDFVCAYFDLPVQNILQKADVLRHKGQILYSPETGKPIKKSDWDNFVKALAKMLNRKYGETGKKIVLDSQSLGRLLDRMLKYNKLPEVKDVKLSDIRYSGKSFSYIAESARNAEKVFGAIDNARLELLEQSAAERITGVTEQMKHDIKQVLIDGVKSRKSKQQISQELFNKLTGTNRDFRKIADTEIQNNINNAFLEEEVSNTGEGEKVYFQRMETVDGATCPFCKKMNGVIAVWSETPLSNDKVDGDPYATIALWEGKDWNGQKDYVANGVFHPYCRGLWVRWNARINAYAAMLQKKNEKYNNAVDKAREEWKAKGVDNPNDKTPGYIERINELYNSGDVQKSLTWSGYELQDRYNFAGLKISIENKKGTTRSGKDEDGHEWHTFMHYDYGYIRGTEGVDGDHVDCYIGDNEDASNVYIIHQNNPVTHEYDEDKCMLGFNTLEEAKEAYRKQYDRPGFMGSITTMSIEEFKEYVLAKNNHAKRINP